MSAVSTPDVLLTVPSDFPFIVGAVDDVNFTCSASVDHDVVDTGDPIYSFTWYNSQGGEIMSGSRTIISQMNNMSTLILSPLSVDDSNITCSVVVAERLDRLDSSAAGFQNTFISLQSKLRLQYILVEYNVNVNRFKKLILRYLKNI